MKATIAALLLIPLLMACTANVEPGEDGDAASGSELDTAATPEEEPRGLRVKTDAAFPGYTLFAPLTGDTTYLIDIDGRVVQTWKSEFVPSGWVYVLDNGHVMRGANDAGDSGFSGGGQGGRIEEWNFDGELVWDFAYNTEDRLLHHDVAILPNGNVLAIVWEHKTPEETRQAGRREDLIPERGQWPGMLIEFEPQRPDGARIVWEWHSFDHLIQNIDASLDNYGEPSEHPERIDFNGDQVGAANPPENPSSDIFHFNGVAYNPELDQIIVSSPNFNELWVIDHSTTSEEAASSAGGRSGKGGDLLYRWGNPQAYGRGTSDDQRFGFEHDTRWIPQGRPGAGNMMIFSNRTPGSDGTYSQVYELAPPIDAQGRYEVPSDGPFGPPEPVWTYSEPDTFDATYISGAERLKNGNTLVNSGPQGRMFEVTPEGEIVWEYWSHYSGTANTGGGGGGANPFSLFRGIKIPPDHPAVAGRDLQPLDPQPPLVSPAP
jgi:hypothetical protein